MIAVCRLRYCPATRAYAARRTTEGKTTKGDHALHRPTAYATLREGLNSLTS